MKKMQFSGSVLLAGAMTTMMIPAFVGAQQVQTGSKSQAISTDLAVTYVAERANLESESCGCFWLQGGSGEAAVTFYHGLGMAVNVTGEHASNIGPGVDLSKLSVTAGPRYTVSTSRYTAHLLKKQPTRIFGEALFGGVHAFDSIFPESMGTTASAGSFSMQVGGGVDVGLGKGFGIRALEVDYVRSELPNVGSNTQNDLRLAFGISYHLGKH
jgi:hypothetical protein